MSIFFMYERMSNFLEARRWIVAYLPDSIHLAADDVANRRPCSVLMLSIISTHRSSLGHRAIPVMAAARAWNSLYRLSDMHRRSPFCAANFSSLTISVAYIRSTMDVPNLVEIGLRGGGELSPFCSTYIFQFLHLIQVPV